MVSRVRWTLAAMILLLAAFVTLAPFRKSVVPINSAPEPRRTEPIRETFPSPAGTALAGRAVDRYDFRCHPTSSGVV